MILLRHVLWRRRVRRIERRRRRRGGPVRCTRAWTIAKVVGALAWLGFVVLVVYVGVTWAVGA